MWGAQARAAEYTAARNASARQASREAEDKKFSPKSTPTPLSAFTKTTNGNRNKGNKAFIPLVLEETLEEIHTGTEFVQNSTPADLRLTRSETKFLSDEPRFDMSQIRVRMPTNSVPRALGAMTTVQDGTINALNSFYHPAAGAYCLADGKDSDPPQSLNAAQVNFHGTFLSDSLGWTSNIAALDLPNETLRHTANGMRQIRHMLVPTDITPTKQEQKLSLLSETNLIRSSIQNSVVGHSGILPTNFTPPSHVNNMSLDQLPNLDQVPPISDSSFVQAQQTMQAYCTPIINSSDQTLKIQNSSTPHRSALHHFSFSTGNDNANHQVKTPVRPNNLVSVALQVNENEQPYGHKAKMEKFMAARQAVAKTGKTVLHNPSVNKAQSETPLRKTQIKTPQRAANCTSWFSEPRSRSGEDGNNSTHNDALIETRSDVQTKEELTQKLEIVAKLQDEILWQEFGVGTPDWCELRAFTAKDRKTMRDVMKRVSQPLKFANTSTFDQTDHLTHGLQYAQWLETDPRGLKVARERIDQIATEHVRDLVLSSSTRETANQSCGNRFDYRGGMIRATGSILANLTEYLARDISTDNTLDHFDRRQPVPDFAIDKDREFINGSSSVSYFN